MSKTNIQTYLKVEIIRRVTRKNIIYQLSVALKIKEFSKNIGIGTIIWKYLKNYQ